MTDWKLLNRRFAEKHFTHFIFQFGNQFAIADHSIDNINDPSSTDDGLLLIDDSRKVDSYDKGAIIPVVTESGEQSWVMTKWENVHLIRNLKERQLDNLGWIKAVN